MDSIIFHKFYYLHKSLRSSVTIAKNNSQGLSQKGLNQISINFYGTQSKVKTHSWLCVCHKPPVLLSSLIHLQTQFHQMMLQPNTWLGVKCVQFFSLRIKCIGKIIRIEKFLRMSNGTFRKKSILGLGFYLEKRKLRLHLVKVTSGSEKSLSVCFLIFSEESLFCGKMKWTPNKGSEIQFRSKKNLAARAIKPCSEFPKKLWNPIFGVFNIKTVSHLSEFFFKSRGQRGRFQPHEIPSCSNILFPYWKKFKNTKLAFY